jgi:SH3-like domain-containing protein
MPARLALCLSTAAILTVLPALSLDPGEGAAHAAASLPGTTVGPSGLPLPRFVSLKASRVNLRVGPGLNYAIEWMYLKSGLPMEIIQEYDNWRRVRDADGTEGWINQSLLSGKRTAIVAPWQRGKPALVTLRADAAEDARIVAEIEPGVIGTIGICNGDWCQMDFGAARGWLKQSVVWGAYPGETIAD